MSHEKHHEIIGGLLETAIRDQVAIQHAVKGMAAATAAQQTAARELPGKISRSASEAIKPAVDDAATQVTKHFINANRDADRAALAYQQAAKFSMVWVVAAALMATAIGAAAVVAVAWMLTPTSVEIQALRDERALLQRDIAALEDKGARVDFTQCRLSNNPGRSRLCARIDPAFESQTWLGGYRILQNK